jgi:hypothetical protein
MAFKLNRIGPFLFLNLQGPPNFTAHQVEPHVRPGIDGTAFRRTGLRGQPLRWRTLVDTPSFASAVTLFNLYLGLIGADPQEVVWADVPLIGQRYQVLEVHPIEMKATLLTTQGLYPPSLGLLSAEWIVWPVQHTEED